MVRVKLLLIIDTSIMDNQNFDIIFDMVSKLIVAMMFLMMLFDIIFDIVSKLLLTGIF